ncbi:Membrane-anchored glycerophosphoryl diester phosphodiesterase (GDPDase), membrane domain [Arthrobacter alpinus]|uniref:Membrane-anchored glycerophosphoryl diester phosphodiesterase (GDPDase), membrane domain n=1 Tax=Arthrobacter alpinus TaxID=656366 RepID=A0A1H5E451_9MICC|nr:hypothetical protein [Arthrobacter alpinus]SED85869.1 Membrane-anchored glycerophosphoryl diester phosphodiesterase (GDPDase), membrane domain [Arthrobacter alpinus]
MMTQGPQQPPVDPQGEDSPAPPAPQPPYAAPLPPQQPPQWGQYAQPGYPAPQFGQQLPGQQYPQPGYPAPQYGQPGFNNYVAPPKPGVIPLRPLGLGEILDGAFQAARRNGKAMFGSALIFQLATTAVTLVVMYLFFGQAFGDLLTMDPSVTPDSEILDSLSGGLVSGSVSLLLTSILAVVIQMILQGALVIPVLRAVLNRKTSFGQMWRLVRPRIGALLLLALLYAGVVFVTMALYILIVVALIVGMDAFASGGNALGAIALSLLISLPFVAVAIWIGTKVLLAPAAIVVENVGPITGIKRSWILTRNNWWRTFGISMLAAIIAGVIGSVITTPVSMLASFLVPLMFGTEPDPAQMANAVFIAQGIASLIGALVGAVTLAFQTGVMSLIYVDLRMRRDGFDIALLKESETGKDDGGIPGSPVPAAQQPGNYGQ